MRCIWPPTAARERLHLCLQSATVWWNEQNDTYRLDVAVTIINPTMLAVTCETHENEGHRLIVGVAAPRLSTVHLELRDGAQIVGGPDHRVPARGRRSTAIVRVQLPATTGSEVRAASETGVAQAYVEWNFALRSAAGRVEAWANPREAWRAWCIARVERE